MGKIVGGAEKHESTPIAISYTRHTSRSLMLWLLTLPFALWPTMVARASVPSQFLVTYMMLGIDEIGGADRGTVRSVARQTARGSVREHRQGAGSTARIRVPERGVEGGTVLLALQGARRENVPSLSQGILMTIFRCGTYV